MSKRKSPSPHKFQTDSDPKPSPKSKTTCPEQSFAKVQSIPRAPTNCVADGKDSVNASALAIPATEPIQESNAKLPIASKTRSVEKQKPELTLQKRAQPVQTSKSAAKNDTKIANTFPTKTKPLTLQKPVRDRMDAFRQSLAELPSIEGLEKAAIAIDELMNSPLHHRKSAGSWIRAELDQLATTIRGRYFHDSPAAGRAYLHDELFVKRAFRGDLAGYHYLENQLIGSVLERGRGLPVILSLIFALLAHRLGLEVVGLNTPGHFLVQISDQSGDLIIDPFSKGRIYTQQEAIERLSYATGLAKESIREHFVPVNNIDWLRRILMSLSQSLEKSAEYEKSTLADEMLAELEIREANL